MPHGDQAIVFTLVAQEFSQVGNGAFVTKPLAVTPLVRTDFRSRRVLGYETVAKSRGPRLAREI